MDFFENPPCVEGRRPNKISPTNALMTCVIEYPQLRLRGVGRKVRELRVLNTRYSALLTIAAASLQSEFLPFLRRTLSTDGDVLAQFSTEFKVHDASSQSCFILPPS